MKKILLILFCFTTILAYADEDPLNWDNLERGLKEFITDVGFETLFDHAEQISRRYTVGPEFYEHVYVQPFLPILKRRVEFGRFRLVCKISDWDYRARLIRPDRPLPELPQNIKLPSDMGIIETFYGQAVFEFPMEEESAVLKMRSVLAQRYGRPKSTGKKFIADSGESYSELMQWNGFRLWFSSVAIVRTNPRPYAERDHFLVFISFDTERKLN